MIRERMGFHGVYVNLSPLSIDKEAHHVKEGVNNETNQRGIAVAS